MQQLTFDGLTLRQATMADEPRVEALLKAADLPLDGVHEALDCFVVAEDGDDLVGVAGIEECGGGAGSREQAYRSAMLLPKINVVRPCLLMVTSFPNLDRAAQRVASTSGM
jgi:hypothetical protein